LTNSFELDEGTDINVEDWEIRTPTEIRQRALVLYGLVHTAHEGNGRQTLQWLEDQNLGPAISPEERRMFQLEVLTERDRINASWRVEGIEALLWALEELPDLSPPSAVCDVQRVQQVFSFFMTDSEDFVSSEQIRLEEQIYDQRESILEHHWKIRDAQIHDKPALEDLNPGVIQEKHYALNWILDGDDWDEVLTDT